jgi:hypothetical protein
VQDLGAADGVVAESLDGQEPSVGGVADLPQGGQVSQPLAQAEVHGLVDGGLGPQGLAEFVVYL